MSRTSMLAVATSFFLAVGLGGWAASAADSSVDSHTTRPTHFTLTYTRSESALIPQGTTADPIGTEFVFHDIEADSTGATVGYADGSFVRTMASGRANGNATVTVTGGTLEIAASVLLGDQPPQIYAVVGGTGLYVGAQGSVVVSASVDYPTHGTMVFDLLK